MSRPEKVTLHCDHCGHDWVQTTVDLLSNRTVIYRENAKTEQRRVPCPNCGKGVVVDVPKEWLADG
jgi:endogenous inhibitor of DNA gyrase (YacG/DUF329 family)